VIRLRNSSALRAVPNRVDRYVQATDEAREAIEDAVRDRLAAARTTVAGFASAVRESDPRRRVLVERARVADLTARLSALTRSGVDARRERLALLAGTLSSLSPLDVLMRGYAVVRDDRGRIVRSPSDVAPGERIRVRVADGEFSATRDENESTRESTRQGKARK
jgi:exodeoxyribonuclease VII large subunit